MRHTTEIQPMRSYRAFVYPRTASTWDLEGEEGSKLVDSIHLKAASSEDAADKARHVTGKAVLRVERKD
ncbi:hypothetical protein [Comamonas koreensis]|uniref:hypothetical protein n=1 Tax=Comamonas koreensis TaxID=160825 RepID=UPI0015FDE6D4|nr:hypothetical protein [Comamonas koreensis]